MFVFKRNIYWNKESLKAKDIEKDFFIPENIYVLGFMEERELSVIDEILMRHFPFMDYDRGFG